jgi:hypothetical protein
MKRGRDGAAVYGSSMSLKESSFRVANLRRDTRNAIVNVEKKTEGLAHRTKIPLEDAKNAVVVLLLAIGVMCTL